MPGSIYLDSAAKCMVDPIDSTSAHISDATLCSYLVTPSVSTLQWVPTVLGQLPPEAVIGGWTLDGHPIYIARVDTGFNLRPAAYMTHMLCVRRYGSCHYTLDVLVNTNGKHSLICIYIF